MKRAATLLSLLLLFSCDGSLDIPGAGNRLTPVVKKRPVLSGHVVDESGRAIANVQVRVFVPFRSGPKSGLTALTDELGDFEFDVEGELEVKDRIPLILDLGKSGYLPARHQLSPWRPGIPKSVEIQLQPAGAVTGRVIDQAGRPVAGALVFALPPEIEGVVNRGTVPTVLTDAGGRFLLPGLPIRQMDIGVLADGCRQGLFGPVNVVVGTDAGCGDIVLRPGGRIAGQVTTLSGEPIRGALVHAFRRPQIRNYELFGRSAMESAGATVRTDADGRFDMTTLPPGSYTVEAEARGHRSGQSSRMDVEPGRTDLVFTLEPEATIELLVFDGLTNQPVSGYDVSITSLSVSTTPTSLDEVRSRDGMYKFVVSEGASYSLQIAARGYEVHRMKITVTAESDRSLRIPLKPR